MQTEKLLNSASIVNRLLKATTLLLGHVSEKTKYVEEI
jgi:hypothetical protein